MLGPQLRCLRSTHAGYRVGLGLELLLGCMEAEPQAPLNLRRPRDRVGRPSNGPVQAESTPSHSKKRGICDGTTEPKD